MPWIRPILYPKPLNPNFKIDAFARETLEATKSSTFRRQLGLAKQDYIPIKGRDSKPYDTHTRLATFRLPDVVHVRRKMRGVSIA
jgi:hypothetical protein